MKKFFSILLILLVLLNCFSFVKADDQIVIKLWIGSPYMRVNGKTRPIDAEGTVPVIVESRTLVPIRAIIESFGGTVEWLPSTKEVKIVLAGNIVELWIGKNTASVNNETKLIDETNPKVVPQIIKGRTMVPLRFVSENLGVIVDYNESSKQITLTYGTVERIVPPTLVSPADGTELVDADNVTFSWSAVDGADYYRIIIKKDGGTVFSKDKIEENSVTVSCANLGLGKFVWQVASHSSTGYSVFSSSFTLILSSTKIPPTLPQSPKLVSPIGGTVISDRQITFVWSAVSNADCYKIQVLKDNSVIFATSNITDTFYILSTASLQNGTYTWQVASHNVNGWGTFSNAESFVVRKELTTTEIAKFIDRTVYIEAKTADGTNIGSGFIISSDGRIATNYHVIDKATSGTVTLSNNTKYNIDFVLGYARPVSFGDKDLAVIKINATNLPVCVLGDSNGVQVGDKVVAIGSPLGIQNVVSEGIVSKIWSTGESLPAGLIQTTAPISQGNSGGPLFNVYGEVIGVNTFQYSSGQNLNIALPINWLKTLNTSLNMTLSQVYQKEYGNSPSVKAPTLMLPEEGEAIPDVNATIDFRWSAVPNVSKYYLWIGSGLEKNDSYKVFEQQVSDTKCTVNMSNFVSGRIYTWAVGVKDASGKIIWSKNGHFSVVKVGSPLMLSPLNGGRSNGNFTWSSTPSLLSNQYYIVLIEDENENVIYRKFLTANKLFVEQSYFLTGHKYYFIVSIVDTNDIGSFILYVNSIIFYYYSS